MTEDREPFVCPHCGQTWQAPTGSDPETIYSAGVLAVKGVARHLRSAHGGGVEADELEEVLADLEARKPEILEEIRRNLAGETAAEVEAELEEVEVPADA